MSLSSALTDFETAAQADLVEVGGTEGVQLQLGASTLSDDSLAAAVKVDSMQWREDERTGKVFRQQTGYARIGTALLPAWATAEDLPRQGKIKLRGKWFKISDVQDQGGAFRIIANRWPDD
jgi:hypothetical protein